jgi:act minimal PKS acyl carrier protein
MTQLTLADLVTVMRGCAGEADGVNLDGDILDTEFDNLGYDSIAMLETTGCIQREYRIVLADDVVTAARTPRELIDLVNSVATGR